MNDVIRFVVTKEEKTEIRKEAKELGLSMSSFIRLLVKMWRRRKEKVID